MPTSTSTSTSSRHLTTGLLLAALTAAQVGGQSAAPGPDEAGVVRSGADGFAVHHEVTVAASPAETYRALVEDVGSWWGSGHTFSGDAANLYIDARPGGCLCETLPDGGGVTHLSVIHANPGKLLRLAGGLGPLQGEAVSGIMTWSLEPTETGTRLTLTYKVSGVVEGGLENWSAPVGSVLEAQLDGLAEHIRSDAEQAALPTDPFELAFEDPLGV